MGTRWAAAAGCVALVTVLGACQPVQPWQKELASPNAGGTGGTGGADELVFSPDGTKIAFTTSASGLGPTDTNEETDVYVRDLAAGTTTLVSVNAAGTDSAAGASARPSFSPDGTKVAFYTWAADLDPPAGEGTYVRDLAAGTTAFLAGEGLPRYSPTADEVVVADPFGQSVVVDVATGTRTVVSVAADGTPGNGASQLPAFSPDGRKVVFQSYASNLVAGDDNDTLDVFVHDLDTGVTTLASANSAGTGPGNQHSYIGSPNGNFFTADSSKVVFTSLASDLVPNDTNPGFDVFVHDLTTGTTEAVSAPHSGPGTGNSDSDYPTVSPDGARVAFRSHADNLVPGTSGARTPNAYVRDLATGTTTLLSPSAAGTGAGGSGDDWWSIAGQVFSPDGTKVAFPSTATNLGPRDTNRCGSVSCLDVYVHDLDTGTTTLVSSNAEGTDSGNGQSGFAVFSPVADQVAFVSDATDLGPPSSGGGDVFLATLTGADVSTTLAASPDPVAPGATLTYTVDVGNDGPDTAAGATAGVLLPEGVTWLSTTTDTGSCTAPAPAQPRLVTCDLGDLPAGASAGVTTTVTVTAAPGATLSALARATSGAVDPAGTNNQSSVDTAVS